MISDIINALSFLTIFPKLKADTTNFDFSRTLWWFPLAGLIQGLVLTAIWFACARASALLAASVTIAVHAIIRRFLHIDGFMDTVDGFAAGWGSKDKILKVMRQSDIGAFGCAAVVLLFLVKVSSLTSLDSSIIYRAVLLYPVVGLTIGAVAATRSSYAREGTGTGSAFIRSDSYIKTTAIIIFGLVPLVILGNLTIIISIVAVAISSLILSKAISFVIGGHSGDTLGAMIETSEMLFLALTAIVGGWI